MRETERIAGGTLLFGPGDRLSRLLVLVRATSPEARARQLDDLDELGGRRADAGLLLVDADLLPVEDLGYLRRFLSRNEGFQITLVGADPSRRVARSLLRLPRVQWPDGPGYRGSAGRFRRRSAPARRPAPPLSPSPCPSRRRRGRADPRRASGPEHSSEDELDRIEAILDLPEPPAGRSPSESAEPRTPDRRLEGRPAARSAREARAAPFPRPTSATRWPTSRTSSSGSKVASPPCASRRATRRRPRASVEALSSDVARLAQFTRPLVPFAAPPRASTSPSSSRRSSQGCRRARRRRAGSCARAVRSRSTRTRSSCSGLRRPALCAEKCPAVGHRPRPGDTVRTDASRGA
jgi:hypothetical protein